ncbi:hypothetical protein [uncultured Bacteroides sp.]|uniref:hypothetical protein n=1 Tax=uncultured Bacteroides sp. TaxID=162156 RepID=UPI002AAB9ECD|nr:hypothetical protein [uncultured Bacteroides sp.]
MMIFLLMLKRPFIWIKRFRHRCGYGVHSPFAFNFITQVVYGKPLPQRYQELKKEEKKFNLAREGGNSCELLRVKRFLLRLIDWLHPYAIVDVGPISSSSIYLKANEREFSYTAATDLSELFLEKDIPIDFLYLHYYNDPEFVKEVFDVCVSRVSEKSVFVIHGICYSSKMKEMWRSIQEDARVGITFDLYDLGVIFFDREKIKQHYLVNF